MHPLTGIKRSRIMTRSSDLAPLTRMLLCGKNSAEIIERTGTVPFANQPVRAEGLGRNAESGTFFSQAVRRTGKPIYNYIIVNDSVPLRNFCTFAMSFFEERDKRGFSRIFKTSRE